MFAGRFNHTLDAKGRIIIPSKLREALGDSFVVSAGLDGCLYLYSEEGWEAFSEELFEKVPQTQEGRKLIRYFTANSAPCESDKQGRSLLPAELRSLAGITRDVVLVGALNKIEVWDKDRYEAASDISSVEEMAEKMAGFGVRF